jgi:hypothetical protein
MWTWILETYKLKTKAGQKIKVSGYEHLQERKKVLISYFSKDFEI